MNIELGSSGRRNVCDGTATVRPPASMSVDPACRVSRGAQGWPGPPSDDYRSQGDAGEGEVLFNNFDVLP